MVIKYERDARKKNEAGNNIKHRRIIDDSSCVSLVHSNVSRAMRVRKPKMPRKVNLPTPQIQLLQSTSKLTPHRSVTHSTLATTEQVIKEPPQRLKRKLTIKTTQPFSYKRLRKSPSITELDEPLNSTQTFVPIFSFSIAPPRQKHRQLLKQKQIENKSIIPTIQRTATQNPDVQISDLHVGTCSPDPYYPTQYYVSSNFEEPETSMTVKQAEGASDTDSD